jgi:WD40 repeat protein
LRNYIISENIDSFNKAWEIPAHRGKVLSIYVNGNYIITGGEDGIIRVWTRKTHELTMQFSGHHSNTFKVFADINRPNIIHSCGKDKNLNCFDVKTQKRANIHSLKNGYLKGITQKKNNPFEISKKKINFFINKLFFK